MKHRIKLLQPWASEPTTKTVESDAYIIVDHWFWFSLNNKTVYTVGEQFVYSVTVVGD